MELWVKIYILSTQLLHTQKLRSIEHVCPSFEFLESRWASRDCRPIMLESCNVSPFVVGPRAARPANSLPRANSSLLRVLHHQVKKADSSTFLLNAARSIYWQGAIFDRQEAGTCGIFWFLWQPCFMWRLLSSLSPEYYKRHYKSSRDAVYLPHTMQYKVNESWRQPRRPRSREHTTTTKSLVWRARKCWLKLI